MMVRSWMSILDTF